MTKLTSSTETKKPSVFSTIVLAWLLAGTLDICSAFIYSYLKRGTSPGAVLQYIAKMVFGDPGLDTPATTMMLAGLLIHYSIALCWTILFFILYKGIKGMKRNPVLTGVLYGLLIWTVMNIVVLPLWNHKTYVFKAEPAIINALILVIAIGLPLSFIAKKKFGRD